MWTKEKDGNQNWEHDRTAYLKEGHITKLTTKNEELRKNGERILEI